MRELISSDVAVVANLPPGGDITVCGQNGFVQKYLYLLVHTDTVRKVKFYHCQFYYVRFRLFCEAYKLFTRNFKEVVPVSVSETATVAMYVYLICL